MSRLPVAGLLIAMLLGALGHAGEGEDRDADMTPGIGLVRLGTVGDLPPRSRLVVNVDAAGRILVAGKVISYAALKDLVVERADVSREDGFARASRLDLVLRIDRVVPWCVVQWILALAADPAARVWRCHFSVLPTRGETEGALSVALPKDRGLMPIRPDRIPPSRLPIRVRRRPGLGSNPALLTEAVREASLPTKEVFARIDADPLIPTGYVLHVIDRVVASGIDEVMIVATAIGLWPKVPSFQSVTVMARQRREQPTIECYGRLVGDEEVAAGSTARTRRGFAARLSLDLRRFPDMNEAPTVPAPPFESRIWRRELKAYGGEGTQRAVSRGLQWLAMHQALDGRWSAADFEKQCRLNRCGGTGQAANDTGVTALALLPFLAVDQTGSAGEGFERTVRLGLERLRAVQDKEGCFGPRTERFTYGHAIATLAMVEAYALTGSLACKRSAQAGVDFIERCRNPKLAWRYGVRTGENDSSVTTWMIWALALAKAAKLKVPEDAFEGVREWLKRVTEADGRVNYTRQEPSAPRPGGYPPTRSLTAMGMWTRLLLGEDPASSAAIRRSAVRCLAVLPEWVNDRADPYYWHFGTLALFQVGGPAWERWNRSLRPALVERQRKDGDQRGSWDPAGPWGTQGGRVYTTALAVLTLQTYYRYARGLGRTR